MHCVSTCCVFYLFDQVAEDAAGQHLGNGVRSGLGGFLHSLLGRGSAGRFLFLVAGHLVRDGVGHGSGDNTGDSGDVRSLFISTITIGSTYKVAPEELWS